MIPCVVFEGDRVLTRRIIQRSELAVQTNKA
jgi:hypothetical protein